MTSDLLKSLKARLYARYTHRLDTPQDRKRSEFFAEWIDVGFLRHRWTNDGVIAEGVLRSNNPDADRFKDYAAQGVRTVLNLRHDTDRAPFALAKERTNTNGMQFVSYPMAARRAPTRDELLGLIDLLPTLEKPVLIHCKSGADRTGLVGAIWRMEIEGEPLDKAREELSIRYLHRRDSETGALDQVLDAYAPFEGQKSFKDWVAKNYDPKAADAAAAAATPKRGFWAELRALSRDLYRYAQYREALWHQSFAKPIETEQDQRRANTFITWIDHGILRGVWRNFHKIGDGVYRSNHPTEKRFRKYAAQGFKTIVNLRGASMEPQYQLEKKLCNELGLTLIDLPLSAYEAPPRAQALKLLDIFDTAEKPMIVHCKSGADRTGIASALYKLHVDQDLAAARQQFSLRFVHLKNGKKGVLDRVIDAYARDTKASLIPVREWLETTYDPDSITTAFRQERSEKKHGYGSALRKAMPVVRPVHKSGEKRIAVITSVRNDTLFLDRWIAHYGQTFDPSSLFVIIDGLDQDVPDRSTGVNVIQLPHVHRNVVQGDKARAARASDLAKELFKSYDLVIGTDVDEFLVVDPKTGKTLSEYLSHIPIRSTISGLGIDVVRHMDREGPIKPAHPFLSQRRYAIISDRYTKASVLAKPLRWGSGYHRVRGRNFHIDPNLFLFHFGCVDQSVSQSRKSDIDRIVEGWDAHLLRRDSLFRTITETPAIDGDSRFASARAEMTRHRPWHAWNKPGILKRNTVIEIPARFRDIC